MKLEEQVCSLELSKQLKEAGVPQESLFYWWTDYSNEFKENYNRPFAKAFSAEVVYGKPNFVYDYISAFTVAELGEMLPTEIREATLTMIKDRDRWLVHYTLCHSEVAKTEADARGQMLLYLINQKLIDLK